MKAQRTHILDRLKTPSIPSPAHTEFPHTFPGLMTLEWLTPRALSEAVLGLSHFVLSHPTKGWLTGHRHDMVRRVEFGGHSPYRVIRDGLEDT